MRILILAVFLMLPAVAHARSGSDLLNTCTILEREAKFVGRDITLPSGSDGWKCFHYMAALMDISYLSVVGDPKPMLRSCPPTGGKLSQFIRIFTNFAQANPQRLHEQAHVLVVASLLKAFPCPE